MKQNLGTLQYIITKVLLIDIFGANNISVCTILDNVIRIIFENFLIA